MKDNVDIAGLCAIQCPTTGATRLGTVVQCRLCDIFTCCDTCPSNMADQCFPPSTTTTTGGGYTPSGWKPMVCEDTTTTDGGSSGGKSSSNVLKEGVVVGLCLALILLLLPW
jgi:hypothetical protein